ncbi:aconitate hydratase [Sutterella sp.]|uniref:aconitate hydratase n=1 Tax=Sutterella sp. TaxID=1981025 RepID=UPI0026E0998B|nr:aconitate hydratase [Sutterella sp.]MDO5532423.1 aconitate hydratase [Sutterella sp.]
MSSNLSRRSLLKGSGLAVAASVAGTPAAAWAAIPDPDQQHPIRNIEKIRAFYAEYPKRIAAVRKAISRPLTQSEKILYAHLFDMAAVHDFKRGGEYATFRPDHLIMQDLLAQSAMQQFLVADFPSVTLPTSIHCDHLTLADKGAKHDLAISNETNKVVYKFLRDVSDKLGIDFWEPGAGIIHQETLENYAYPGCLIVGCDSHTPNGSGLAGMAIGIGGADAVDCMSGMPWELPVPKVIGVKLEGELKGWTTPKDIILKVLGMLTVKGGTNAVIEYFGPGVDTLSATGKATIANMGAELGATSSVFPYDSHIVDYLRKTGRAEIVEMANKVAGDLRADQAVYDNPEKYYDKVITIDLAKLEPQVSGPFTPDAAMDLSSMKKNVVERDLSDPVEAVLIGSCTNSSYEDITRSADLAKQALEAGIDLKCPVYLSPGSNLVKATMDRDGLTAIFEKLGVTVLANACGACVGMWKRPNNPDRKNTIVAAFNRNFRKRNDLNPKTESFLVSPDMAVAYALSGRLSFNPLTDPVVTKDGKSVMLRTAKGIELPEQGYARAETGCHIATFKTKEIKVDPTYERLQLLDPFPAWDGKDLTGLPLLMKVKGKCTTDHITPSGKWINFVGNIRRISDNTLSVAQNAFVPGELDHVWNQNTKAYDKVSSVAKSYKAQNRFSIVVGDENYGEGSSREQAAMQPRYLNVQVILVKSFARIHESNLKKQGILALTFANPADYDRIQEKDTLSVIGMKDFAPGKPLTVVIRHENGTEERIEARHSYNENQIPWFRYGSALNMLREERKAKA